MNLLPIGQRVTHFDGGPGTHGKGTIVAYNGRKPNLYAQENLGSAAEIAAQLGTAGLESLVDSFYDGVRCPYVVQFDPSEEYPTGYKDVYEPDSIRPIEENCNDTTGR